MQHTIGIPGTLGGLICMNGGSQRKGIGDNVEQVTVVEQDGTIKTYSKDKCGFAYRQSAFQKNEAIITDAVLVFEDGDKAAMRREMIEIMYSRRTRFPLKLPNCGSVFVSDPSMYSHIGPPGKAIEAVGLKGLRVGNAQSSPQHANFIVNLGDASSNDVLGVIRTIRMTVHEKTGYYMDCEVRYVAPDGNVYAAHEVL
jgi:UDP-N-acetylmuramate dehydrogenase